jgi:tetratricopeptide (TPR) repeat protein
MVAQKLGDHDQALDWYRQALAIFKQLGDHPHTARTYHQLGNIAFLKGNSDEAVDWYRQALAILKKVGDRDGMARTYAQLGGIAFRKRNSDEALDWYRQALAIFEELGDRDGMARTYAQLGNIAFLRAIVKRDSSDQALDWYRRALAIFEELGDRPTMAAIISQVGDLLTETGNPKAGLSWSLQSLRIRGELGSPQISDDLRSLQHQRALLGARRFQQLLRQELGGQGSQAVMELLQQLPDNEEL